MAFFLNVVKGIIIGAGAILPGISSGVFCVIFGIYEKLINSILNLKNDFKKNFFFLLPYVLGGAIGVFLFGNVLNYFFQSFPVPTKSLFLGFILGSIPTLLKKANSNTGFRLHYLVYLAFTFVIGILSIQLEKVLPAFIGTSIIRNDLFYYVLSGFFMSAGIVIPGVSSTVILMTFGVYSSYLEAISTLNFLVLIPLGVGVLMGCFILLKFIRWCFQKHYCETFYCIIGFVLGSVFVLNPGYSFNVQSFLSILLLLFGFLIGLKLEKLEKLQS